MSDVGRTMTIVATVAYSLEAIALLVFSAVTCAKRRPLGIQNSGAVKLPPSSPPLSIVGRKPSISQPVAPVKTEEEKRKAAAEVAAAIEKLRLLEPRVFPKTEKQIRIETNHETCDTTDYPTIEDVLSDWDSDEDSNERRKKKSKLKRKGDNQKNVNGSSGSNGSKGTKGKRKMEAQKHSSKRKLNLCN